MSIEAAIFDCDGTILDSMPMWTDSCVGLLERYGVVDARKVFYEHESLDMYAKCQWYHEHLGIGQSTNALYDELWKMVEAAYGSVVAPYEGCREFLQELKDLGVPCVIVSSTPPRLVRSALETHGLDAFFDDVIFAGEVGRGKEHPDCYLYAWRMLGTERKGTWVFEDAPFGVRSAAHAGFPTVAILNDHDGRDPAFLQKWATVVARSYGEIGAKRLSALAPRVLYALVVGGSPEASSAQLVKELAYGSDCVIAVDRGACVLNAAHVRPNVFCGDEDSVDATSLAWVSEVAGIVERHPVEKDDTDLGLAIASARQRAEDLGCALRLTATCVSGGRPDHALGVWGVLARNADLCPIVREDSYKAHVLSPNGEFRLRLHDRAGNTVSVIALREDTIVSEQGMRWNLSKQKLGILGDRGVSNRVVLDEATIWCHSGVLAVFEV